MRPIVKNLATMLFCYAQGSSSFMLQAMGITSADLAPPGDGGELEEPAQ